MRFNEDGELFVHVKQRYSNLLVGTLCFKLVPETKTYVIGWSTVSLKDIPRGFKKKGREIARNRANHYVLNGQERDSLFNMAYYSYDLMYEAMWNTVQRMADKGYYALDKSMFPMIEYTTYPAKELLGILFNEPIEGPDGKEWKIVGYTDYMGYLVKDGHNKMEYAKTPEQLMYQFRYQGDVIGVRR